DLETILARRNTLNLNLSAIVAQAVIWTFDDYYITFHLRMDIAIDRNHAGTVERHGARIARLKDSQIESFHIRTGEDIVRERIFIREVDLLPDCSYDDMRPKLFGLLFHHQTLFAAAA